MADSEDRLKRRKNIKELIPPNAAIVLSCIAAVALAVFAWIQVSAYENSMIEVFANQQDNYLLTVLNEIEADPQQKTEERVTQLLSNIDSTDSDYWTLSKDNTIVFVKDMTETNRYRGLKDTALFNGERSVEFLVRIPDRGVRHDVIEIGGQKYIASGASFMIGADRYRLCFITAQKLIDDNNAYISGKVNLGISIAAMLGFFVSTVIILSIWGGRWRKKSKIQEADIEELQVAIEELNHSANEQQIFDVKNMMYDMSIAEKMYGKLIARRIFPSEFVLASGTENDLGKMSSELAIAVGEQVMKFRVKEGYLLILFVNESRASALGMLRRCTGTKVNIEGCYTLDESSSSRTWTTFNDALDAACSGTFAHRSPGNELDTGQHTGNE